MIILLILTTFSLDYILIFREKIDLGLCHEVLGQFCAKGITFFLYPTQNAPVEDIKHVSSGCTNHNNF